MERKITVTEFIHYVTVVVASVAILILMISLTTGLGNTSRKLDDGLERIEKALITSTIARTSVMHGFFQDQQDPKNSGLRMIRVAKDGTLLVAPPPRVPLAPSTAPPAGGQR